MYGPFASGAQDVISETLSADRFSSKLQIFPYINYAGGGGNIVASDGSTKSVAPGAGR